MEISDVRNSLFTKENNIKLSKQLATLLSGYGFTITDTDEGISGTSTAKRKDLGEWYPMQLMGKLISLLQNPSVVLLEIPLIAYEVEP